MSAVDRMTLAEAAAAFAAGTLSARALAEAQLARIDATDGAIEAWAHLDPAQVRREADRLDGARAAAPLPTRAVSRRPQAGRARPRRRTVPRPPSRGRFPVWASASRTSSRRRTSPPRSARRSSRATVRTPTPRASSG